MQWRRKEGRVKGRGGRGRANKLAGTARRVEFTGETCIALANFEVESAF